MHGNKLRNYLIALRRQFRKYNAKAYVSKIERNIVFIDNRRVQNEAFQDRTSLREAQLRTNIMQDPGEVIDMCKYCSDKSFHVDYVYSEIPVLDDEALRAQICDILVAEIIDLSNIPEDEYADSVLYTPTEQEMDDIREYYADMVKADRDVRVMKRIFLGALAIIAVASAILVYCVV